MKRLVAKIKSDELLSKGAAGSDWRGAGERDGKAARHKQQSRAPLSKTSGFPRAGFELRIPGPVGGPLQANQ
jgi:hypothetical protein